MGKEENRSFGKNMLSIGAGTIVYMIVGFIGTPIITRLVDPVDYGQMSMLSVYSSFLMMFCGLGLDQTLVRYFYHSDEVLYKKKLLSTCCLFSLIAFCFASLFLVVASGLGKRYDFIQVKAYELFLLLLNAFALLLNRYVLLTIRLTYKTRVYSIINVVQKALYILITIILVLTLKEHHFVCLAIATICSTLIATFIGICANYQLWIGKGGECDLPYTRRSLIVYGLPLMMASSISVMFNALDKLALNHFCSVADVGVYASAMNIMAIFAVVKTSFTALWMPSAIDNYERDPNDRSFYRRGNGLISCIMIIFGAGVVLLKDLVVFLLGEKYANAAGIIPFLMFEPIMYTISDSTATGIAISKKTGYQLAVASGACMANFIGNLLLTPRLGSQGAAISTAIAYILFFAMRTGFSNKLFYIDYRLKQFSVLVIALFGFACFSSFTTFSFVYICLFGSITIMTLIVYREYITDITGLISRVIAKLLKKP